MPMPVAFSALPLASQQKVRRATSCDLSVVIHQSKHDLKDPKERAPAQQVRFIILSTTR